jgi:DNA-binding transcriptional regulator/RsmH inhibitor MraZ
MTSEINIQHETLPVRSLRGHYERKLYGNTLVLPKNLRERLAGRDGVLIFDDRWENKQINFYPDEAFEALVKEAEWLNDNEDLLRVLGTGVKTQITNDGHLKLPRVFRDTIQVGDGSAVVISGSLDHIKIRTPEELQEYIKRHEDNDISIYNEEVVSIDKFNPHKRHRVLTIP